MLLIQIQCVLTRFIILRQKILRMVTCHLHYQTVADLTGLDWNKTANDFYRSLGAVPIDDCTVYRLDAAALERLSK